MEPEDVGVDPAPLEGGGGIPGGGGLGIGGGIPPANTKYKNFCFVRCHVQPFSPEPCVFLDNTEFNSEFVTPTRWWGHPMGRHEGGRDRRWGHASRGRRHTTWGWHRRWHHP